MVKYGICCVTVLSGSVLIYLSGQFGRVYLALLRDPRGDLTEHVAVKTMKCKLTVFYTSFILL